MIRFAIAAIASLLLVAGANAQSFPGYGASGNLLVGQDSVAPPAWKPITGDCTVTAGGVVVCTKTNGSNLGTMATQNANAVAITGGTIAGAGITGLSSPTNAGDAANKMYVDNAAAGLAAHTQVRLATATALPANTYSNGTAGVGATLTATSNAALTVDGVAVVTSDRITVKNEASAINNGIYTVTNTGSGGAAYVLTRATDANTPGTANSTAIGVGTFTFVTAGTANANTGWIVNAPVTTIGTSSINWVQFTGGVGVTSIGGMNGAITCGFGISCSAATINTQPHVPTNQVFLSGSGTYTTPANVTWIEITLVGGGGGAGGAGTSVAGTAGGATCWNTTGAACTTPVYSAGAGGGGSDTVVGASGTISGSSACLWSVSGGQGQGPQQSIGGTAAGTGGAGGVSTLGGAGSGTRGAAGLSATANTGSGGGGGGASTGASLNTGAGGGAGATCKAIIGTPAGTYTYVVGTGGTGHAGSGGGAFAGGGGGAGQIIVLEHYGS